MCEYRVFISEPAEHDLWGICRYISAQLSSPQTALDMVDEIEAAIRSLSEMPARFALVGDERLALQGYRKMLVKNYLVFYLIDEEAACVDIVRILYARRDWQAIL